MPKCYHCAEEISQPFHCNGCGQDYCHLHQDPVVHNCSIVREEASHHPYQTTRPSYTNVVHSSPTQVQNTSTSYQSQGTVTRGTTDGTYTWYRQDTLIPEDAFSPDSGIDFKGILFPYKSEFLHLLIGAVLIFIIGLIAFYNELLITMSLGWAIFMLAGFYMTAFLFHEFGHRQVAKHFGFPTKFRLLTFGMGLTAFSVVMGLVTLISGSTIPAPTLALPGAVVVLGLDKISKETGLCKAAGPIVNLIYGSLLLVISFIMPNTLYPLNFFIGSAASLNFMLGSFNMIPIGILDGQNIFKWSKSVYFILIGSLLTLLIFNYIIIYDPNLQLIIFYY